MQILQWVLVQIYAMEHQEISSLWCHRLVYIIGTKNLLQKLRKHSATLGKRILVHTNQETEMKSIRGHAVDIDEAGRLIIESDNGDTQVIAVADVEHLRLDAR